MDIRGLFKSNKKNNIWYGVWTRKKCEYMKKSNIVNGNIICRISAKKNVVFPTCFFYENIGCTIM